MSSFILSNLVRLGRSIGKAKTARPKQRRPAVRPLAIEAMECRTMLSATTVELAPFSEQPDIGWSFTLEPGSRSAIEAAALEQGGFISMRALLEAAGAGETNLVLFNSHAGTYVAGTVSPGAKFDWLALDVAQRVVSIGLSESDYTFSGDLYGNDLPPAVIGSELSTNGTSGGNASPAITPVPIEQSTGNGLEGGSVSIAAIATALKSPNTLGPHATYLANSTLASGPEQSAELLATTGSADETISGEWARAITFETVRDEASDQSALDDRRKLSTLLDREVTEHLVPPAESDASSPREVVSEDRPEGEKVSANQPTDDSPVPLVPLVGTIVGPWMTATLLAPVGMMHEMANGSSLSSETAPVEKPSAEALAEVFADWAPDISNEPQSLAAHRNFDVWNFTPLLLVLALERISSGNSRRAKPSAGDAPSRPALKS